MNYGVPYMGSKNRIATAIVEQFPYAENFYDLFAGGCAVTHAAILSGKFNSFYASDLDGRGIDLFKASVCGDYRNEKRWVSREEFFDKKNSDPYIGICWSFGNNKRTYMYSRLIEPYKKALHYLLVCNDSTLFDEFYYFPRELISPQSKVLYIRKNEPEIKKAYIEHIKEDIKSGDFKALESLQRLQSLQTSKSDYRDIEIKPNSVIYCDIPYEATGGYVDTTGEKIRFDYESFYAWCEAQSEPVFISSYAMPLERFKVVKEMKHNSLMQGGNQPVIERLFMPVNQKATPPQLSLFDDF